MIIALPSSSKIIHQFTLNMFTPSLSDTKNCDKDAYKTLDKKNYKSSDDNSIKTKNNKKIILEIKLIIVELLQVC